MSYPLLYILNNIDIKFFYINKTLIIFWALLYATNHNINYLFFKSKTHKFHHNSDMKKNGAYNKNKTKIINYGIDTIDILFNTKHKHDIVENFNHSMINIIILTIIIILIKDNNIFKKNII